MKTSYMCEVCGFTSEGIEEIERCEEQGKEAKYSIGQSVIFLFAPRGLRKEIEGEIVNINFAARTHKVSYGIFVGKNLQLSETFRNCVHNLIPEEGILSTTNTNA